MRTESSNIISLKVDTNLGIMLEEYASKHDRSKSYVMRKALETYLRDQQDLEDGIKALIKHNKSGGKTVSLEKIIEKYGLQD